MNHKGVCRTAPATPGLLKTWSTLTHRAGVDCQCRAHVLVSQQEHPAPLTTPDHPPTMAPHKGHTNKYTRDSQMKERKECFQTLWRCPDQDGSFHLKEKKLVSVCAVFAPILRALTGSWGILHSLIIPLWDGQRGLFQPWTRLDTVIQQPGSWMQGGGIQSKQYRTLQ